MTDLKLVECSPLSMSSREIAKLCGKQHRNVRRDIEKMLKELEIDVLKFEHTYHDLFGREQKEHYLPKCLMLTLVSGYNVKIRSRIIDRWLELEKEPISRIRRMLHQCEILTEEYENGLKLVEKKIKDFAGATG